MKNIVTIGGGTGTFVVLSALRTLPNLSLSAIVTAADDGGSTGKLRDAYGILPPGDARQALVALAEEGTVLRDLFAYRFSKGDVAGHSFGNLFLTALTDLRGSDALALEEASKILRVCGTVIPATDTPATLRALLADGTEVIGQNAVSESGTAENHITELSLKDALPLADAARKAMRDADYIILGPGLLYSSTIAALLPNGMKEAIQQSNARILYVANLFTKTGETDGYTLADHVREIARYAGREPETILVHSGTFSDEVLAWYANEGEFPIPNDMQHDARVVYGELASSHVVPPLPNDPIRRSLMRHDSERLARIFDSLFSHD